MTSQGIVLKVTGMTCGHCANTVQRAAAGVAGVEDARVDLARGELTARVAPGTAREALAAAVAEAGYGVAN